MSFSQLELLGEAADPEQVMLRFYDDLGATEKLHHFLITTVPTVFDAKIRELAQGEDLSQYDYSDAMWDAERALGVTPWEVNAHSGMMAVTRAVTLSELALAKLAAAQFVHPELTVLLGGKLWNRDIEALFYKHCLKSPFTVNGDGFGSLRSLRDMYVHGYGLASSPTQRTRLARKLYQETDVSPITSEEENAGYKGTVGYFGSASLDRGELVPGPDGPLTASLTPLAAHRAIRLIRTHIQKAHFAILQGVRQDQNRDNNRFFLKAGERLDREQAAKAKG